MAVITMSRQIGSGADQIANRLCERLGLAAFDKESILRVATSLGLSESEIVDYSVDEYRSRGFFSALFGRSRSVVGLSSLDESDPGYKRRLGLLDEEWAIGLIRGAVYAAYNRDDVLIVGRGGQAILHDRPKAFHVRIVAPTGERIKHLQATTGLSEVEARETIQERDRASREYLRSFYGVDVEDPNLYHLVLNTGRMSIECCVNLIVACMRETEPASA